MRPRFKIGLTALVIVAIIVAVMAFTYWAGTLATGDDRITLLPTFPTTPVPTLPVDTAFARVNPLLVDALRYDLPTYGDSGFMAISAGAVPLGSYLPRTGQTAFALPDSTPLPTPLPYPTSPPLFAPDAPDATPFAFPTTDVLNADGTLRTLPYGGDACAPAGWPVEGPLTQRFHAYHPGIDLAVPLGTPVLATHSGTVIFAGMNDIGYGNLVIIQNGLFITYYGHNLSFNVTTGQQIGKGSVIAFSGSTGNSSGPHVHYETRLQDVPIDPLTFEARGYASC